MARPIRVEFPGAVYHVTARGNERKLIYRNDDDRRTFLETLQEMVQMHGARLHGFCLMPNHYHLLVETPRGNLSRAIGWMQTTYSIRFNHRYRRSGHLFQGRFKAHLVEADSYAMELLRYVHLNPVRPRKKTEMIPRNRRGALTSYRWSSHLVYAGRKSAPEWLSTDWLSFFAPRREEAQRCYRRFVEDAFGLSVESPWNNLRLGLVLGGEKVVERVRDLLKSKPFREEVRWVSHTESVTKLVAVAQVLAREQEARNWQVWVRVRLGGERKIDVARAYGYQDGSAITQILKRLRAASEDQPEIATRMARLEKGFAKRVSSVKS